MDGQQKQVSEPSPKPNNGDWRLEYSTCVDFIKYAGGVQIAQISVFLLFTSGFVYFLSGQHAPDAKYKWLYMFGAAIVTSCLWAAEESHALLVSKFFARAQKIEETVEFNAFRQFPPPGKPVFW